MKKKLFFILSLLPVLQSTQAVFSDYSFRLDTAVSLSALTGTLLKPVKKRITKNFSKFIRLFYSEQAYIKSEIAYIKKKLLALARNKKANPNSFLKEYSHCLNIPLDEEGNDAIMIAAENGNKAFLESALKLTPKSHFDHKINLKLKNKRGYGAASLATVNGHADCLEVLLNDERTDFSSDKITLLLRPSISGNLITLAVNNLQRIECLKVLRDHASITNQMKVHAIICFMKLDLLERRGFLDALFENQLASIEVLQELVQEKYIKELHYLLESGYIDWDIIEELLDIFIKNNNQQKQKILLEAAKPFLHIPIRLFVKYNEKTEILKILLRDIYLHPRKLLLELFKQKELATIKQILENTLISSSIQKDIVLTLIEEEDIELVKELLQAELIDRDVLLIDFGDLEEEDSLSSKLFAAGLVDDDVGKKAFMYLAVHCWYSDHVKILLNRFMNSHGHVNLLVKLLEEGEIIVIKHLFEKDLEKDLIGEKEQQDMLMELANKNKVKLLTILSENDLINEKLEKNAQLIFMNKGNVEALQVLLNYKDIGQDIRL